MSNLEKIGPNFGTEENHRNEIRKDIFEISGELLALFQIIAYYHRRRLFTAIFHKMALQAIRLRRTLINWIRNFVNAYKIDGIRIILKQSLTFHKIFTSAAGYFELVR
eukprot:TRINITY_DN5522_c0_g1_i4.p1 TRINITY_DN5522_c0_g1~~TRINITY_DN5522_c0_g1_i4.p1  ORF type:complete len:108 (-),score=10.74 TRINITY_DN5522_c0_g1_i4:600-923(-)